MPRRPIQRPGPAHPIGITRNPARVVVQAGGRRIADSGKVLTLREANLAPVHYFPREDVDMDALVRSDLRTWCPYKGEAAHFGIQGTGTRGANAAWSYEEPHEAAAAIKGRIAFYPDRVDCLDEWEASAG